MGSIQEIVDGLSQKWQTNFSIPLHEKPLDYDKKTPGILTTIRQLMVKVSSSLLRWIITCIILTLALFTLLVVMNPSDYSDGTQDAVSVGKPDYTHPDYIHPGHIRPGNIQPDHDNLNNILATQPVIEPVVEPSIVPVSEPVIIEQGGNENTDSFKSTTEEEISVVPDIIGPPPGHHRLVILLPADNPSRSLCKTIFSLMVTGYPSPVILNWKGMKESTTDKRNFGSSHLEKIGATLEYLEAITQPDVHEGDRLKDDDLVVLADAFDVWWQLPPYVMLKRYHESNRIANERLAREWTGPGKVPMKQTIISSAQKRCWPGDENVGNRHCKDLPESSARKDLYGPNTDKGPENSQNTKNQYHDVRPKYFNSGTIMGPVGDMKRYFRRVNERMEQLAATASFRSDQAIFGDVFGEQEVWRTLLRNQHKEFPINNATKELMDRFEFSVGLDYTQGLFIPTVFEEEDGEFVRLNNKTHIAMKSESLGIDPVRLRGIPDDIHSSRNPLKKFVNEKRDGPVRWGNMPLYADYFSEAIPVAVHHNAHRDGAKQRRVWWWDRTWYFPYLREMIKDYLKPQEGLRPIATLSVYGEEEVKSVYWPPRSDKHKRKPRHFMPEALKGGLTEFEFSTLCRDPDDDEQSEHGWWDEVLRDGKGRL